MRWQHPNYPFGPLFSAEVELLVYQARQPGRRGMAAVALLLHHVPRWHYGDVLVRLWREPLVARMSWASTLSLAWRCSSHLVQHAAGSRERLIRWFKAADYSRSLLPAFRFMRADPATLPTNMLLYRGGTAPVEATAAGLAWTPRRADAAYYAMRRARRTGEVPIILRSRATPADILWAWPLDGGEILVDRPADCRVAVNSVDRIVELARTGERLMLAEEEAAMREQTAMLAGITDEAFFGGWVEDEEAA